MLWINFKRTIKAGFVNFWRNGFVSLSSVLVMIITLSVIGGLIFMLAILNASLTEIKNKVDINVYFVTSAQESEVLAVKKILVALPQVEAVTYVSRDENLAAFKTRYADDAMTLQALAELSDNPLRAALNIKAKDPSQYETIANLLQGDTFLSKENKAIIDNINYFNHKAVINRLSRFITSASQLGFAIAIILAVISVLISLNTIRLVIYISREEISVMRLVGASNTYIRGPFVVTGIMYGVVSGLATLIIFYPITYWLGGATAGFFSGVNVFSYYLSNFSQFFGIVMGSGIVLGAFSSFLAVRRYLKE